MSDNVELVSMLGTMAGAQPVKRLLDRTVDCWVDKEGGDLEDHKIANVKTILA